MEQARRYTVSTRNIDIRYAQKLPIPQSQHGVGRDSEVRSSYAAVRYEAIPSFDIQIQPPIIVRNGVTSRIRVDEVAIPKTVIHIYE